MYAQNHSHGSGLRVRNCFDWRTGDAFETLVAYAYKAQPLLPNARDFLADIEDKYEQWGDGMFWSEAQADYLEHLARRGGWVPAPRNRAKHAAPRPSSATRTVGGSR